MEDLVPLMAIICIFVVLPALILNFIAKLRETRSRESDSDRSASTDLARTAERMERRIEALERILDTEAPGWRNRHHG